MGFDFDTMRVFLAALDHGSFSAAARVLKRVPSSVSMSIANLEAELGLLLFDRSGREPKPTGHAVALAPRARLLVEQLQQLNTHALSLTRGLETTLTVVLVPELIAAAPWSAALRALSLAYPLLCVDVLTAPQADALEMVHSGRAQLALVFERYGIDPREGFQEVAQETLVAVVAPTHPLLRRHSNAMVRDGDLLGERQIVAAGRDAGHVDKRIAISRLQWRTDSPVTALGLVLDGLGWAWLPSEFVGPEIAAGRLMRIPAANFSNILRFFVDVVWSNAHPQGLAATRMVELLRQHRQVPADV